MSLLASSTFEHLRSAELTDQGLRRARNEDAIIRLPAAGVFCVADGIGGADAGEEASSTTVLSLLDVFTRSDINPLAQSFDQRKQLVHEAMNRACAAIRENCQICGYRESGTTAVTMVFDTERQDRAAVLHAGDSRAYRFRRGQLERLTRDHAVAVEASWPGQDAWTFGMRTIITRAVGVRPDVELEESVVDVLPDDVYLLCTDGLTRMLSDQRIEAMLNAHGIDDPDATVRELVRAANHAGGKDNITVLLVHVTGASGCRALRSLARGLCLLVGPLVSLFRGPVARRRHTARCSSFR
jgi:protein phosphatase